MKSKFFYLNIFIFLAALLLIWPMFSHVSSETLLFHRYSLKYFALLAGISVLMLLLAGLILFKGELFQKVFFFNFLILFAGIEIFIRLFSQETPYQKMDYLSPRPYVGFINEPGSVVGKVVINDIGFRGEVPSKIKPADEFRVFLLGGSTAFNGYPPDETISAHLEKIFHKQGYKKIKIYNWAVTSYVSAQELSLLVHYVIDYQPDGVIIFGGGNDIASPYNYDPRPNYPYNFVAVETGLENLNSHGSFLKSARAILLKSKAVQFLFKNIFTNQLLPIGDLRVQEKYMSDNWKELIINNYIGNLKKMSMLSKQYEFKFAVFLQPFVHFKNPLAQNERRLIETGNFNAYLYGQYDKVREQFDKLKDDMIAVDLSYIFENVDSEIFSDYIHITNDGNRLIAQKMFENLSAGAFIKEAD